MKYILFYLLIGFVGYVIGRFGHVYLSHIKLPHHWIYGAILIGTGLFYYNFLMFSFGTGHFISDLKDFWHLKVMAPDKGERWFWGID